MPRSIEETRKAKRDYMARKRAADPEAARAYSREYHHRNRKKQTAKMREYYARRFFWGRAMKLRKKGRATAQDLASIWRRQRGCCALTGRRLDRTAQLDHITPQAIGGTDAKENLRWVCEEANIAKRHLTDAQLIRLCADILQTIGLLHEFPGIKGKLPHLRRGVSVPAVDARP